MCIFLHIMRSQLSFHDIIRAVENNSDIFKWFYTVRGLPIPKFITGIRGTGKSTFLFALREQLIDEGVPHENILVVDTDDPDLRRRTTHEQMLDHIFKALPSEGKSYILIREAAALPDPEIVIGTLAASARREIFATSSSRRLLDRGLAGYFASQLAHYEMLPPETNRHYSLADARSRWNDIFINDVLAPSRILEVSFTGRIAGWLSDHLGEPVSLRGIANAISPARRVLSPHTIESYLASLEDAHLVEKVIRWEITEDAPLTRGYRYFFTDPELRLAYFGPAPQDEIRKMALNRAWLHLRRGAEEIFFATGSPDIDFITRTNDTYRYWRVADDGSVKNLKRRPRNLAKSLRSSS